MSYDDIGELCQSALPEYGLSQFLVQFALVENPRLKSAMRTEHDSSTFAMRLHGFLHHVVLPASVYVNDVGRFVRMATLKHFHVPDYQRIVFGI